MFRTLLEGYKRWRHSKGYGVHSPFAFFIVETVITPGRYGYYGYEKVEKALSGHKGRELKKMRDRAFFLLRLMSALRVKNLENRISGAPWADVVAQCAGATTVNNCNNKNSGGPDTLLVTDHTFSDSDRLKTLLANYTRVVIFNPSPVIRDLAENLSFPGVMFTGLHTLMMLPRPETHFVNYTCRLP